MSTKTKKAAKPRTAKKARGAARADGAARTDRLRKAVLAEIDQRVDEKPKRTRTPKAARAVEDQPAKRTSALDAAATVLAGADEPMGAKQMIDAMAAAGLWSSPAGKTPHATLYAAILREITTRGGDSRFVKVDRGRFTLAVKGGN